MGALAKLMQQRNIARKAAAAQPTAKPNIMQLLQVPAAKPNTSMKANKSQDSGSLNLQVPEAKKGNDEESKSPE